MTDSVFAAHSAAAWPYHFRGRLHVPVLAGGVPTDPKVAESWLRTKIAAPDDVIRDMVAEAMVDRGADLDEAMAEVVALKHLNGFKRDDQGLYIEGRQLKAAIKEAGNVRWPKAKWGPSNKGTRSFFAEHVFVVEDRLHLGVTEASNVVQRFVHTWRGSGIQHEEVVENAEVPFTLFTDYKFTDDEWALLWLTGEQQGIGASRSQGYGRYTVTEWEPTPPV